MEHLHDEASRIAMTRVLKARTELVMSHRFYGVLVSNVEPVITRKVETAATDGKKHYWNPDFVATLTPAKLLGTQGHESGHDALHHSSRRGGRDPRKWNEACDYAINIDLRDAGFELPDGALIDERFRDMSAEDIYRIRELDEQRAQQQQQEQPEDQGDDEESSDESQGGNGSDENDDADASGDQGDSAGDDEADDEGDEAEGQGGGDAEGDDQGEGAGEAAGEAEGEAEGDAAGNGNGAGGDAEAEGEAAGNGGGAGDSEGGDEAADAGAKSVVGDVGGCGEVLDAAETPAELAAEEAKWEKITRQAAALAKAIGDLPGHVTRDIERANTPAQDWREVLRAWFDQGALRSETWTRPNRRFVSRGLILPGSRRDGVSKAVVLVDTSGSVDEIALAAVASETQAALDDGAIDELVIVYGDTEVTRVDSYHSGDEIEFDPRGGGGTELTPLFDYVRDNHDDASLIVCFTDMEVPYWPDEPACPTLFAVHGYPQAVREYMKRTPWDSPAIDVGVH
jgi:predicted metal-dependent peptidase